MGEHALGELHCVDHLLVLVRVREGEVEVSQGGEGVRDFRQIGTCSLGTINPKYPPIGPLIGSFSGTLCQFRLSVFGIYQGCLV
jgi:hypothetical protein